jgi:hypothetical protein
MKTTEFAGILETRMYSPASLLKAYLRRMGIAPILERQPYFSPELLGYGMVSYFGGRSECRIRRTVVPVTYLDFTSMYPSVMTLQETMGFITADYIYVVDETERIRGWLHSFDPADCFDPGLWTTLNALVQVVPDDDVLPVRGRYSESDSWGIGVNPFSSEKPRWYALPDVVASTIITGGSPRILRALTLVPFGKQHGLRSTRFRGAVKLDPLDDRFFVNLIEERKRIELDSDVQAADKTWLTEGLKTMVNSAYGIFAEIRRHEGIATDVIVYGNEEAFLAPTPAFEEPGPFSFPPLAACITAGARLMLALLEHEVTMRAGSYAFCDTDSMAIVSTPERSLVPCAGGQSRLPDGSEAVQTLSFDEVDEIRENFNLLSPYYASLVPSLLKLEKVNFDAETGQRVQLYCDAISAKRYVLFSE